MSNTDPAQEPSMEEILASIRKIISDDDSAETGAADGDDVSNSAPAEAVAENGVDTAPAVEPEMVEMEDTAVVEEPAMAEPAMEAPPAVEPEPVSAEPIAAEVEQPVDTMSAELESEPEMETMAEIESVEEDILELSEDQAVETVAAESAADMAMENADPGTEIPADIPKMIADVPEMVLADDEDEIGFCEPEEIAPKPEEELVVEANPEAALISEDQGAGIASAFGSLENLVLSNEKNTLDGLVRDMLKPMLKEWLDANLPPLVDRMVRDEIQRVSRGRK
ncbi:MAG: DUF2497 domain-containing protein [Rhizobiales bacterium]|nr:DUF2497 domain-containing protein [Hyphomicrobiales bacterium]